MRDPHDAEDVRLVDASNMVGRGIGRRDPVARDPGVVDEDVEPRSLLLDRRDGGGDGRVVGHVELYESNSQLPGCGFPPLAVARPEVHRVPEVGQTSGRLEAEPLVATRDERDRHAESPMGSLVLGAPRANKEPYPFPSIGSGVL